MSSSVGTVYFSQFGHRRTGLLCVCSCVCCCHGDAPEQSLSLKIYRGQEICFDCSNISALLEKPQWNSEFVWKKCCCIIGCELQSCRGINRENHKRRRGCRLCCISPPDSGWRQADYCLLRGGGDMTEI